MSRNLALYFDDILTSIGKIKRYTADMTREIFIANERTFDAVAHHLQVIGEAVKNIPNEMRDRYPQIEWRKISGLQDILAHAYSAIDDEIIWDIVQTKLTELRECIAIMKASL